MNNTISSDIEIDQSIPEAIRERIATLNKNAESSARSETSRAEALAQEAYDLSQQYNYHYGQAHALLNLGRANRFFARFDAALPQLEEALEILKKFGDSVGVIGALNNIGHIYNSTGHSKEALDKHLLALYLSREIGNTTLEANSHVFIGNVYSKIGNHSEALHSNHQAYELFVHTESISGQSYALNNIGNAHHASGNYAKALEYYLQSLPLKEATGDNRSKATAFNNIGSIYFHLGDFKNALAYYELFLELERNSKDRQGESVALSHIGTVYHRLWQYDLALSYFRDALKLAEIPGDKRQIALCLSNLGKIHIELGELDEAYRLLMSSIQILGEIGEIDKKPEILTSVAQLFIERNDPEKGLPFAKEALAIAQQHRTRPQMYEAHLAMSRLYRLKKDFEKSLYHFEKFHTTKDEIYNDENTRKTKILEINYNLETARHEAEIHRLKNVELVEANERLTMLIAERNDMLEIVAHDLKNPLAGISLSATLLDTYSNIMEQQEISKHLKNITSTADRITGIISQLLALRKLDSEAGQSVFTIVNFTEIIRSSIEDYRSRATSKSISLAFSNSDDFHIRGDDSTLRLIMDNLLSNAIKFSPLGKKIAVIVKGGERSVLCSIQDEGPGITEEDRPKLFLKFAQLSAKPTGGENSTGLGLSIVKKFTESMNGSVRCEPNEGSGATFTIEFPLHNDM